MILYLRKQNEVLSTELQLAEQTASRLRSEAAIAKRAADQASAQLISQMEQSRQSQRTESDHRASMAQQEQINLLRESNQALRYALPAGMPMKSAGHCHPVVLSLQQKGSAILGKPVALCQMLTASAGLITSAQRTWLRDRGSGLTRLREPQSL